MLMNEEITSWFNMEVFAGINSVMHDARYDILQLARKHIDAHGHFTGCTLDQQIYNYLLSAKRHATTNSRSEIKNIYRYLLPIIENNDIGW